MKFGFDAVGRYARPDIFRLEVNERPTPAVSGIAPALPVGIEEPVGLDATVDSTAEQPMGGHATLTSLGDVQQAVAQRPRESGPSAGAE